MMTESIESWTDKDIYVVSLFVYDCNDNPSKSTVMLGYNTESQAAAECRYASGGDEARWNFAFWRKTNFSGSERVKRGAGKGVR